MRYRWEIPFGISFFFKGKSELIVDKDEMRTIMKMLEKEYKNIQGGEEGVSDSP